MRIITATPDGFVPIGKQGENAATQVQFPVVEDWTTTYGAGVFQLVVRRPTEQTPYAVSITTNSTNVLWIVLAADVAIPGLGSCELRYVVNNTIAKSQTFLTKVEKSIEEPWREWVEGVLQAGAAATGSAASAAESATAASSAQTAAETANESAQAAATRAGASEEAAETAATRAAASELNASESASSAQTSASAALQSKNAAVQALEDTQGYATSAGESASAAADSASAAATSAQNASASATAAQTSATNAGNSASAASTSASAAATSAQNASASATAAQTSATNAGNSATAAQTAQTAAETAQEAAEAAAASLAIDDTLTVAGQAADAKAVGDAIKDITFDAMLETTMGDRAENFWTTGTSASPAKSVIIKIDPLQAGSGDPSSENVRAISGITSYGYRIGKGNLYGGELNGWGKYCSATNGNISNTPGYMITDPIDVRGLASVYVMWKHYATSYSKTGSIVFFKDTGEFISGYAFSASKSEMRYVTQNVPAAAAYMIVTSPKTDYLMVMGDAEYISEAFPANAGTVYGGYIDVINGKLVVTKGYIDSYNGETLTTPWISSMDVYVDNETPPTTGAQVVYDLTEPVEYDLTPHSVMMRDGTTMMYSYVTGGHGTVYGMTVEYTKGDFLTTADIDATLSAQNKVAGARTTGKELEVLNNSLFNGYAYKLDSSDFFQQGFSSGNLNSGESATLTSRIGIKEAIKVNAGAKIILPNNGLYYHIWFLKTPYLFNIDLISTAEWSKTVLEYTAPEDCYFYLAAAKHTTAGHSVITPEDLTGTIYVINNNYIDRSVSDFKNYVDNGAYPYIGTEADRVSEKVRSVQTGNSLTFVAVSDMHYNSDSAVVKEALTDMKDGINAIKKQTNIDFFASFGDITYRLASNGNFDKGKTECIEATKLLNACFEDRDQIRMIGNHDPNSEASTGYFTANQLNAFAGIYSNILTKDEVHPYAGIGYHDFERQKIRMIALDTSFYGENTRPTASATYYAFGDAQAYWLCQTLDLSEKDDADEWQIILVSHIQIDLSDSVAHVNAIGKYSAVLNAYVAGSSWSSGTYSYNFSEKNAATLALCIHGHSHNYRVRNTKHVAVQSNAVATLNTLPIADVYIPNALPDRDNPSMDGVTYTKTRGSATSTAFQLITLDHVNRLLYAHHYGAGIDIILHYAPSTNTSLSTDLDTPEWNTNDSTIATVSDGTITPVATGNVMIWAKSETDNCIECWNYNSVV